MKLENYVVNCFRISIFAVAKTISNELLSCQIGVVNCFRISIFAVAKTIARDLIAFSALL